jgi:apolipoprotein N-acyltransferase
LDAQRKDRKYNSALLLNNKSNPDGRYDKIHRVPFGEYVPLRDWLPFMNWFSPYNYDYSLTAGDKFTRFTMDGYRFGVVICYEDTDPSLARHHVNTEDDGPPVDFLVNISNDGWFDGTSEHEEHLAVSRFRAIECRRAMVRSVNLGISAVIDGNGRVLKATRANPPEEPLPIWYVGGEFGQQSMPHSEWASFKKVSGVLVAAVPLDKRFSVYAYAGDWLPGLCWLLIAIATVGTWIYARFRSAAQT